MDADTANAITALSNRVAALETQAGVAQAVQAQTAMAAAQAQSAAIIGAQQAAAIRAATWAATGGAFHPMVGNPYGHPYGWHP